MHALRISFVLGILILPVACTVGPNYHAPAIKVEAAFNTSATQPASLNSSPMITTTWWQTLKDPLLDRLMDRAVASNLDIKIARYRVKAARVALAYASSGQYPQASVEAAYSYNRLSQTAAPYNAFNVPGFPWEYNQYQAGFDASWEVDVFGRVRRGVEAAQADLAATDADSHAVLVSMMAEVARNYVDFRGYQQRHEIALDNLHSQRETLELTQDRRKQGVITELDVAQAASQVAKTKAQIFTLQRQQVEAMHRIALLLGQQPESLTAELSPPRAVPIPPAEIAIGLPVDLLRRRPDIQRAERQVAAATARIGQATADLYPRFTLTGNFTSISATDFFNWPSRSFSFGPSVTWPIFDAGRLRRVVDIRSAEQEQAVAQYERTVLGALEEVHNAIVSFQTEQERSEALDEAVKADQTAVDVARAQYRQGVVDFLNVLDAQRSLFESQEQLVDSNRAVTTSLVALYKALGGGWGPAAASKTNDERKLSPQKNDLDKPRS